MQKDQQLRAALSSEDGWWDWDLTAGTVHYLPPGPLRQGPHNSAAFSAKTFWQEMVHPADRVMVSRTLQELVDGQSDRYEAERRIRLASGDWVWVLERGHICGRATDGRPLRLTGQQTDISRYKSAVGRFSEDLMRQRIFQMVVMSLFTSRTLFSGARDASYAEITQTVAEALNADRVGIWHYAEQASRMDCMSSYGLRERATESGEQFLLERHQKIRRKLVAGQTCTLGDTSVEAHCSADGGYCQRKGIKSAMLAPVFEDGKVIGMLSAESKELVRQWNREEEEFLSYVAHIVSFTLIAVARQQAQKDLVTAKEQAETANRAKSAFLARMSHEIRTPLTAIIGFAESTLDMAQTRQEQEDAIHTIIRSGRHLRDLINDVLDFSKIEVDRMEMEWTPIDLMQVLADCAAVARAQTHDKGIGFSINLIGPLPRRITTDALRLKQILINLCSNAVKFTEQGDVRLIVSCDVENELLVATVFDSGIGISTEQQGRIFDAFSQADNSVSRRYGGTGLGLSISKNLAEKLGGDLRVVSEPALGSIFVARVATGPLAPAGLEHNPRIPQGLDEASIAESEIRGNVHFSGRILLAEDNPDIQRLMVNHLTRKGIVVAIAENGEQAVEKALHESFDLILMDMQMPVMDGLEATRMLRGTLCTAPIFALSANCSEADRRAFREAGSNGFLTKPIDWMQLHEVLSSNLTAANAVRPEGKQEQDAELEAIRRQFMETLPGSLFALERAAKLGDWAKVQSIAHQLKGTGTSFGFSDITIAAGEVVAHMQHGQMQAMQRAFAKLIAILAAVTSARDEIQAKTGT